MTYKKVIRQGKGLAIILPAEICRALDISYGDYMTLFVIAPEVIVLKKVVEEAELPTIKID